MTHGVYLVTGKREYRGHTPGSQFAAVLDRNAERRAIARGDIQLLARVTPTIDAERITFATGWLPPPTDVPSRSTEAPEGASLVPEGG